MNRRQFVSAAALPLVLSGCLERGPGGDSGAGSESSSNGESTPETDEASETCTATETATPEDCWPRMCAGTAIVNVEVARSFSGDVVLEADCRETDLAVEPGDTVSIERTEEAESCPVRVSVDDDVVFDENIVGYQQTTITVTASGEIEVESVVL